MNLIFIYGPPAVGKLTVAKELEKITGYKIFHNHLTEDLAETIYPDYDQKRFDLANKLRYTTFEHAAMKNTDLIFTFVFSDKPEDEDFIFQTMGIISRWKGTTLLVQLVAPLDVLKIRVKEDSRLAFHKLTDPGLLQEMFSGLNRTVPNTQQNSLCLDTSVLAPGQAANEIVNHFNLIRL